MSPVTVESSQPAPQQPAPEQPAQSAQPQSANNQSVRIAALVVLGLVVVGVIAYLVWGRNDTNKPNHKVFQHIGPIGFSAQNLAQESQFINTKFFWAGKRQGYLYEFTRTTNGNLFVRYLPPGVAVNSKPGHFLIVATYPFTGAYQALKHEAKARAIPGPDGSLIYVRRKDPKSVLMGFPESPNDQVEIYAPTKIEAIAAAQSGDIRPVRQK